MTTPLKDFLAKRRAIMDAATPGPYHAECIHWEDGDTSYEINDDNQFVAFRCSEFEKPMKAKKNAELYVDARNTMETLLKIVEVQDEALSRVSAIGNESTMLAAETQAQVAELLKGDKADGT